MYFQPTLHLEIGFGVSSRSHAVRAITCTDELARQINTLKLRPPVEREGTEESFEENVHSCVFICCKDDDLAGMCGARQGARRKSGGGGRKRRSEAAAEGRDREKREQRRRMREERKNEHEGEGWCGKYMSQDAE